MADTLTVTDNRTGKAYTLPIDLGSSIRATDLSQIKKSEDDPGDRELRPVVREHRRLQIQGRVHRRRQGHPPLSRVPDRELAEKSSYLEVAYLIVKGELPTASRYAMWQHNIKMHTMGAREPEALHGGLPVRTRIRWAS
jgi:citrate synthase